MEAIEKPLVSVFTATYNRASSLPVVYESLCQQTYRNFEWIIVDDGSSDGTEQLVSQWKNEAVISIRYFYQDNNGKHIAMNKGLIEAKGIFFANLDSDDYIVPSALETMLAAWESIPKDKRCAFAAVKARCVDPDTGFPIGREIPGGRMETTVTDAKYIHKINFEMWSMSRTEIRRKYPNPDIRGGKKGGGLRFYPEGIWQDLASKDYHVLLINQPLRAYTRNTSTSLMGYGAKYDRSRENIHLWSHVVNHNLRYFFYDPKNIGKAIVGVSMDGFFLKKPISETLLLIHGTLRKALVIAAMPIGYFCYLRRRRL